MSIEPFMYLWKGAAYDRFECHERDDYGNPIQYRFYRKGKLILKIFVSYDDDGNFVSMWAEKPKKETKKK